VSEQTGGLCPFYRHGVWHLIQPVPDLKLATKVEKRVVRGILRALLFPVCFMLFGDPRFRWLGVAWPAVKLKDDYFCSSRQMTI